SAVGFAGGQGYDIIVTVTDNASNGDSSTTRSFSFDNQAPSSTVTAPTAEFLKTLAAVTGTAADTGGSGLSTVSIKLRKTGDANGYWTTGSTFTANSAGATAITATSSDSFAHWSADVSGATFASGQSYDVIATV